MKSLKSLALLSLFAFLLSNCEVRDIEIESEPKNGFTSLDTENSLQNYLNSIGNNNARASSNLLSDLNTDHIYKIDRTQDNSEIFSISSMSDPYKTYVLQIEDGEYYGYSINLLPTGEWYGDLSNFTGDIRFDNLSGDVWRRAYIVNGENASDATDNGRIEACYYSIDVFFSGYEDSDGNVFWTSVEFGDATIECDDPPGGGSLPPPPPPPPPGPKGGGNNRGSDPDAGIILEDELKKCDPGFVKNINNECVPCPNGDCSDCSDDQFRDICGKCVNEVISTPEHVEGRCNGIRQMSVMHDETGNEVTGFLTADQVMIILPNGANSSHGSETSNSYTDEYGNVTHSIYEENGTLYMDYYNSSNQLTTIEIIGHYHTHPFGGQWSPDDQNFVTEIFAAAGSFYFLDGNSINQFDQNGVTDNEYTNCKRTPDETECD